MSNVIPGSRNRRLRIIINGDTGKVSLITGTR